MKTKRKYLFKIHFKTSQIIFTICFINIFISIFLFVRFNKSITPKLLNVAKSSINKLNETILTDFKVKDIYPKIDLENAIILTKNSKEEIISVDFNLENIYQSLSMITGYLQDSLNNKEQQQKILKYYDKNLSLNLDGIVLSLPIGVASPYIFLANLGPRIPVKITYMDYVASSVKIKLENYGINNVLISIYINCTITNEFIIPAKEEQSKYNYDILVASKIIQGIVPSYYGGILERQSNILNIPLEQNEQ